MVGITEMLGMAVLGLFDVELVDGVDVDGDADGAQVVGMQDDGEAVEGTALGNIVGAVVGMALGWDVVGKAGEAVAGEVDGEPVA